MKQTLLIWAALLSAGIAMAQTDSSKTSRSDTIRIGGMLIIKRKGNGDKNANDVSWERRHEKRAHKNLETNYLVFDLGFANISDKTDYGSTAAKSYARAIRPGEANFSKSDFNLNTGKSVDFNLWFFMQRRNLIGHVLNLKYGLGIESNNYRFENAISFKQGSQPYVFRDSINFSKNKLALDYVTIPVMLNINTDPTKNHPLVLSFGATFGYLYSGRNKQVSSERGKQTNRGNYDLEPFKINYTAEIGLGGLKLYASYSPKSVFKEGLDFRPYNFGLRFGGWD